MNLLIKQQLRFVKNQKGADKLNNVYKKKKKMTFELKNIDGKHFICYTKKNQDNEVLVGDVVLENWKNSNDKIIYIDSLLENIPSSLDIAKIYFKIKELKALGFDVNIDNLNDEIKTSLVIAFNKTGNEAPIDKTIKIDLLEKIGKKGVSIYKNIKNVIDFIKESFLSVIRFFGGTAVFREKDFWFIFADCSYKAVGIISLVSFLVGLIVAFVGAIQLKSFGAGIYVASMVSIGMTRIMAAIMVGIVMAGRTGSNFAATIGTMQVNEEIDALKTLGVKIYDYLVAPRIVALVSVIGVLTLLADVLGILGGAIVGVGFLNLSSSSYFDYAFKALSLNNVLIGVFHSLVYGFIIALAGCYEGLSTGRNADSVGKATTNAMVYSLVWMIVATGIITIILEVMGI